MTRAQLKKKISKLRRKRRKRAASRKHHYLEFKRFKKQGKGGRRNWHLARFLKDRKACRKLDRLIEKNEKILEEMTPASGTGAYAGTESIVKNEVIPVIVRMRGSAAVGSQKRWETYGNPGSDHYAGNTTAYAVDAKVGDRDYELARAIYHALTGNPGSSWPGDYQSYYIQRAGRTFRVQEIAVQHGTGPHCHSGVRLI